MSEYFAPKFTDSSFGFAKGGSERQAIRRLQALVNWGREWSIAVDLQTFLDDIPYGLILKLIRQTVVE